MIRQLVINQLLFLLKYMHTSTCSINLQGSKVGDGNGVIEATALVEIAGVEIGGRTMLDDDGDGLGVEVSSVELGLETSGAEVIMLVDAFNDAVAFTAVVLRDSDGEGEELDCGGRGPSE